MATTIQISNEIKSSLDKAKIYERETYNEVIAYLLEESLELNEKTKREIEEARMQVRKGETVSHEEVMKKYGL
ncbi:MAG: hypothetical protein IH845_04230 [Nanoarchaeota archaeon]|nr:hypothetical protein [Nanoarchaeota archaeon]